MSRLCFGCMQQKEDTPVCEHCGFDENTANLPHQLPIGTLLQNQYLVGRVLGQGGFGITYMGWDEHLSIPVAIKEYYPRGVVQRHTKLGTRVVCATGEAPALFAKHRDRFLKEARTLAQLSQVPEIVQIKSFFAENDTAYIVMEYVEGITLKDQLKKLGRPMTEQEALDVMKPVLSALQKVHEHGLIHRDISPDNIMLPNSGGLKLIDFGAVRYLDDSGNSKSTESVLKPGFAPVEQYSKVGDLGSWTDIYAVCSTYCYLLSGKVPPDVNTRIDMQNPSEFLDTIPHLSDRLKKVLDLGMKLHPADRLQTVDQLLNLLYESGPEIQEQAPTAYTDKRKWLYVILPVVLCGIVAGILSKPNQTIREPSETEAAVQETTAQMEPSSEETFDPVLEEEYLYADELYKAGKTGQAAIAFGKLGDYKDAMERSLGLWDTVADRETIVADIWHTVAVKADGSVTGTGVNRFGERNLDQWSDIIAVSLSSLDIDSEDTTLGHTIGLKRNGTVLATGNNEYGQCDVQDWENIVSVTCNAYTSVGLQADGTLVMTGADRDSWADALSWTDILAVKAGKNHIVGLKSDFTVIAAGSNDSGQCDISEWTDIMQLAVSDDYTVGVRSNGQTVIAGYSNIYGQPNLSHWNDIADISASRLIVGLRRDGTVVTAGYSEEGADHVSRWTDIVAVSNSLYHSVGLRADGTVVSAGWGQNGRCDVSGWSNVMIPSKK